MRLNHGLQKIETNKKIIEIFLHKQNDEMLKDFNRINMKHSNDNLRLM